MSQSNQKNLTEAEKNSKRRNFKLGSVPRSEAEQVGTPQEMAIFAVWENCEHLRNNWHIGFPEHCGHCGDFHRSLALVYQAGLTAAGGRIPAGQRLGDVTHLLRLGDAACRKMPNRTVDWPPGHYWDKDVKNVTCQACILAAT